MNELERYEQIEAYLKGSLKGAELVAFEKQLGEDSAFAKRVEQHRIANVFIKKNSLLDIKEMVAQEDRKADKARRNQVKVGGAFLLLLGLSLLVYFQTFTPKKQESPTVPAPKEIKEEQKLPPVEPGQMVSESMEELGKGISKQDTKATKPLVVDKEEPTPTLLFPFDTLPKTFPRALHPIKEAAKAEVAHNKNVTVSPCEGRVLSADIKASPSCQGTATGSIQVSGFRGGVAPYQVEVRSEGEISSPSYLASGKYEVVIKDSSGCTKTIENIWVKEQECETDFAFNPFTGDEWKIPAYPAKGTLTIFDELGKVYFRSEIRADEIFTWSGYSTNGELKIGFFPFAIQYQDGHSKTGSVTIGK